MQERSAAIYVGVFLLIGIAAIAFASYVDVGDAAAERMTRVWAVGAISPLSGLLLAALAFLPRKEL